MKHLFDVEIAKLYGVDVAIFVHHISYWVEFNKNEGTNLYDGKFWTYNKISSFPKHFPYWSHKQVERIINKCFDAGLLIKSNFNKAKYDRTCWYTLSDLSINILNNSISRNREMDFPKSYNGFPEIGTPIPNNKPYINTDIKDKKAQPKKKVAFDPCSILIPSFLNKEIWGDFVQHRKEIKKPLTELASKKILNQLEKMNREGQDVELVLNNSIANGWQGIFPIKPNGVTNYAKPNGSNGQKSDWQIEHFKRVLGDEFPFFGLQGTGESKNIVSEQDEHDLQRRRRLEQSSNSLDKQFNWLE